jgi:DNA-binding HxlR family transcriptional regulator
MTFFKHNDRSEQNKFSEYIQPEDKSITMDAISETLADMVALGLIEVAGYTDSFEPQYSITSLGKLELEMYAND